ncbi:hypothetical protein AB0I28_24670 [Phytomonospora sp. NPDC050363]|uniref:hypothetical protein n=1 Tax=Phytomonospora sp. NPDC050363 TaxID=3155642 RepID=UPI0033E8162A
MPDLTPLDLADEIELVSTRLDALRRSAAVFWIDLHGPVPAVAHPVRAAKTIYGDQTRVVSAEPLARPWSRTFTARARSMGHFDGLFPGTLRAEPEFLLDWTVLLVEEALGPVRAAWRVEHEPVSWYAAIWADVLLLTDEWSAVVSLTNDS